MRAVDIIEKKRDGHTLSTQEIAWFLDEYLEGKVPDYQMSSFLMAVYFNGMEKDELREFTKKMIFSGDVIEFPGTHKFLIDKHSTGGVGDKTTIALAGLFAAFDIGTAKLSGRGLGHTGGTIDKFEAISGFHFPQTKEEMIEAINKTATGIMGASEKVVPLDKKLYALRDVTGTVMSIPLIASSIMSKKLAVYADGIILDVKVGSGAFMKNLDLARELAKSMLQIGESFDRKVVTVLTEMDQPLGYAVGNALEVVEAVETLKGRGPKDFTELCETLVAVALQIKGDVKTLEEGKEKVAEVLKSGKAVEKLKEFINYYGGNGNLVDDYTLLPQAKNVRVVLAKETGYVARIEAEEVGKAAMVLGAGRETKEDNINHAVGIILSKKIGDYVETGDVIATLYYDGDEKLESSLELLNGAYKYSPNKVEASPVVKEIHSVNI
ncbi:MAG: thymidine phosphorylase [Fusobacteriaceae bacterium]|nr:thymidine phosphorylase [Fusobacteriaceae bacterium]MBP6467609.1 thymidine phosphorylase [Fusobacteriaceae bacterium]MBP9596248.1 thymidine phosphorylase [Fusobacteriaceae bacterium]MBU9917307.1 thymidine phosphorylase [Fusobacteriaceae bacterium]